MAEIKDNTDSVIEEKPQEKKVAKPQKKELCKVLSYDESSKELDVLFKGFGIKIYNVENYKNETEITIYYKGDIGKSDFDYSVKA